MAKRKPMYQKLFLAFENWSPRSGYIEKWKTVPIVYQDEIGTTKFRKLRSRRRKAKS